MYNIPSAKEFREFLTAHNLTGSAVARLVGKDTRTIRRYTAPKEQPGSRAIQWDTWALLRIMVGTVTIDDLRKEISPEDSTST